MADLKEKLRDDILEVLSKLSIKELELLKGRFEPSEVIDEAIKRRKEEEL